MGGGGGVFDSDLSLPGTSSKGEIIKSNTSEMGPNSGPNSRETWLSPFASAWRQQFQASPPWGQLARSLRPLIAEHGDEEVLRRWKNYLLGAGAQYVSPTRFATTFGAWTTPDPDAWRHDPSQFRPGETTDDYIARRTSGKGR